MTLIVTPFRATLPAVAEPNDAARVKAVAEMARDLGMRVSALVVGDVRIMLAAPWGPSAVAPEASPQTSRRRRPAGHDSTPRESQAQAEFGRKLPDATVKRLYAVE